MKVKKNGILIWYNLKGRYDLLIFKNGHIKNKFKKEYKELFESWLEHKTTDDEFFEYSQDLMNWLEPDIIEEIDDIKTDKNGYSYIIYNEEKVIIDDNKLDYGC